MLFHGFILPFLAVIDPNSFGLVWNSFCSRPFFVRFGKFCARNLTPRRTTRRSTTTKKFLLEPSRMRSRSKFKAGVPLSDKVDF